MPAVSESGCSISKEEEQEEEEGLILQDVGRACAQRRGRARANGVLGQFLPTSDERIIYNLFKNDSKIKCAEFWL